MLLVRRNGRDKAVAVASCAVASIACARLIPSRLASLKGSGRGCPALGRDSQGTGANR